MNWLGMNAANDRAISATDHIIQSVRDILITPVGSRVMRRDYGSELFYLIDQPQHQATRLRLMAATVQALINWEPRITITRVDVRGGGMGGAVNIDMGLDDSALDVSFTFGGYGDQLLRCMGEPKADGTSLRFAGSTQRDDTGEVMAVEIVCRGRFKELDRGTLKAGDNTQAKVSMVNTYYKETVNGQVMHEIDLINMIEIGPDGVDRMAEHRKAIGL